MKCCHSSAGGGGGYLLRRPRTGRLLSHVGTVPVFLRQAVLQPRVPPAPRALRVRHRPKVRLFLLQQEVQAEEQPPVSHQDQARVKRAKRRTGPAVGEDDELLVQNDELLVQNDELSVQNNELLVKNDELLVQNYELLVQNDDLLVQNDLFDC